MTIHKWSIAGWAAFLLIFSACQGDKKDAPPTAKPQTSTELTLGPRSTTIYNDFPATIEGIEVVQLRPMVDGGKTRNKGM
ncbi:hypothetical protein [Puia sp.]|jgi:membrane fusion protein (multidrug efflux system)|uniref:hypothetical protein n=1 Tax=Puia sp. TaxID=2045100 RepID=UPI002F3ECD8C